MKTHFNREARCNSETTFSILDLMDKLVRGWGAVVSGAQENRRWEGDMRWWEKGWEAGVLDRWEVGGKSKMLIFFPFINALEYFQNQEPKTSTCVYYLLRLLSKQSNRGFHCGLGTGQIDQLYGRFCPPGLTISTNVF